MGSRGPVGRRSDEDRHGHRTKEELAAEKAPAGPQPAWLPPNPDWHEVAHEWYLSLAVSGQAQFYEQSDIATAYYVAEAMSRNLGQGQRFSAQLFASVMSAMSDLLVTEGSRRRVKVELQREQPQGDSEVETAIKDLIGQFQ